MQIAVRYETAAQGKALLEAEQHVQDMQDMGQGLMMVECRGDGYDVLNKIKGIRVDVVQAMELEE